MNNEPRTALLNTATPPCESGCEHYARCRIELLACQRFSMYVEHGDRSFGMGARVPGKMWFAHVFRGSV